jgi:hypothetical protein
MARKTRVNKRGLIKKKKKEKERKRKGRVRKVNEMNFNQTRKGREGIKVKSK